MLNDSVNVHNRKAPRFAEIFKLAAELAERDIQFKLQYGTFGVHKMCMIWYWDRKQLPITVLQGTGTDGFEDGLLEIDGLLHNEVEDRNVGYSVGGLTAENVLKTILKKEAEKC